MDTFFNPMVQALQRNLLKYSAGRAMFCPQCDKVADARKWVCATLTDGREVGICAPCFDGILKGRQIPAGMEVVDGRQVFARPKRAKAAA